MSNQDLRRFEKAVASINHCGFVPILTGTAALESLTGLNFGSELYPITLPESAFNEKTQLNIYNAMLTAGFKRKEDSDDITYYDGQIEVVLVTEPEVETLMGDTVDPEYYVHHHNPDYDVLNAVSILKMFRTLSIAQKRPTMFQKQDLLKVEFLQKYGYTLDRLATGTAGSNDFVPNLLVRVARPEDYVGIDAMILDGFDSAMEGRQHVRQVQSRRRHRFGQVVNTELVAILNNEIVGQIFVDFGSLISTKGDKVWIYGRVLNWVVTADKRGRGIGHRLMLDLEMMLIMASPAILLIMEARDERLQYLDYRPLSETEIELNGHDNADYSIKELFSNALKHVDGYIRLPQEVD
ncbi:hypothetical protein IV73_GL000370 [Weissella kandleri]|uniref:N-acetyltransferase domain-containing protein n=1 Tax=Weissella kandleri TaxID=1616 RepID=A0A0R2JD18_9LACO|nr:hypothetical protein [Weissella kandleri]KRN75215.1 hypothetical protein IV73_GL000370 [Weissella kandleri]